MRAGAGITRRVLRGSSWKWVSTARSYCAGNVPNYTALQQASGQGRVKHGGATGRVSPSLSMTSPSPAETSWADAPSADARDHQIAGYPEEYSLSGEHFIVNMAENVRKWPGIT